MARRIRRSTGPLDLRASAILRAVIEAHVASAAPVGSHALVARHGLSVSPATVRNILAELELAGYLTHPHTSAGRIPTDAGYRWYVSQAVDAVPLPEVEQRMIRHQFGQVEFASEHWFRLAASTIAAMTHAAGIATPAKPVAAHVRRIDLIGISERLAALVLILREGAVKQVLISCAEADDPTALSIVAGIINELATGRTADQVETRLAGIDDWMPSADLTRRVGERVVRALREYDAEAVEAVFSDGLLNVMGAPEFAQSEKLRRVFEALENRSYLGELVETVADAADVRIFIGGENSAAEMRDVSLVLARYGRPDRAVGVVGVLGPTRMAYPQAIGAVRFVSSLMNELIDHLYA